MRNLSVFLLLIGLFPWAVGAAEPVVPAPSEPVPYLEESRRLFTDPGVAEETARPRFVVTTDYLLWWLREGRLPATLTTSSPASRGLLSQPDTQTLYGDDRLETRHGDRFNGIEAVLAYWLDDDDTLGIEGSAFFLERDSTHFKATSDGSLLLARPYELPNGNPASAIIAGPAPGGPRSGGFVGYSRIELFGQQANLVAPLWADGAFRLDGFGGGRFLQLRDRTDLTSTSNALPGGQILTSLEDHYRTGNAFYGGQLGLRGKWMGGRWSVQANGAVSLGANEEQVRAFGASLYQTPTERLVTPTGLTVQASNTGTFDRTALNLVSEAGCHLGFRVNDHVEVFAGYTFLLWDGPLRSGDQVDPVVNRQPSTLPARPTIPFKEDVFWAQGMKGGVEISW